MGVGCSKACTSSHDGEGTDRLAIRRNKVLATVENRKNPFAVSIECYCVPSSRILSHPTALLGPGAGCRWVVVTTINIEKREDKSLNKRDSKLNSAIYTPVIQWFGVNVKQQVPRYLPMNLWPGSYTVFGFYNREDLGSAFAKLTAKVGSEEICLQEEMETERRMSNETWSNLARQMEKELQKLTTPVKKPSYDPIPEQEPDLVETVLITEETEGQRVSQDTGYMSTKPSIDQSPYSLRYIGNTSDSDTASLKGKQSCEKKLKFRRKDTPVHGLHNVRLSTHAQNFKVSPLHEEHEAKTSPGHDSTSSSLKRTHLPRPLTPLGFHTHSSDSQAHDSASHLQLFAASGRGISKSFCDLRVIECTSPVKSPSYSDDGGKKTITSRRKKKSIISKIGGISITAESETSLLGAKPEMEKDSDIDADADDEADVSCAENEQLSTNMKINYQTKDESATKEGEEIIERQTSVDVEKEEASVIASSDGSLKHQCTDDNNIESTAEKKTLGKDSTEDSISFIYKNTNLKKFSFSKITEPQVYSTKDDDARLCDSKDAMKNDNESGICKEAKLKQKVEFDKQRNENTEDESEERGKSVEQKHNNEFEETASRPRSRTLSKRNVFEKKEASQRYIRQSKSVSSPSSSVTSKRGGKKVPSVQGRSNEKATSDITEPPLTPKEAFGDS